MRLIDADAKIMAQFYDDEYEDWIVKEITVADYLSFSDTPIPFVDAVPVVYGRWIIDKGLYRCSICNRLWSELWWAEIVPLEKMIEIMPRCPKCGAKMDGGAEE